MRRRGEELPYFHVGFICMLKYLVVSSAVLGGGAGRAGSPLGRVVSPRWSGVSGGRAPGRGHLYVS